MISDLTFYLEGFTRDVHTWEQRFKHDKNDRIFTHYTLMSQTIREKAKLYLTPTITELQKIKDQYGAHYQHKDLPYHVTSAITNCTLLKTLLKEIVDLYEKQTPYEQISIRWDSNLASLNKRLITLKARLLIIQKILAAEAIEDKNI